MKLGGRGMGGLVLTRPPDAGGRVVLAVATIFDGTEEEGKKAFKALYDIGPVQDTMKQVPYHIANQMLHGPQGFRVSMKGAVFPLPLHPDFVKEILGKYTKFTDENPDMEGSMIIYELFDPFVMNTLASNQEMSFANRGWHMNANICPYWTKPENDVLGRQWARDVSATFDKWFEKAGRAQRAGDYGTVLAYGNYDRKYCFKVHDHRVERQLQYQCANSYLPDYDSKGSDDLFGLNYPRLQKLKGQYDPGNVFNKQFPVTPKA